MTKSKYVFKFYGDGEQQPRFKCNLDAEQCSANTISGALCRRRVVLGLPFCFRHLETHKSLKVMKSAIPNAGKGLFAYNRTEGQNAIIFKKGQKIVDYTGEDVDEDTLDERYGEYTAPYALQMGRDRFIDGACRRGVGTIINHKPLQRGANAVFTQNRHTMFIKATADIKNGKEIFVSYTREEGGGGNRQDYAFDEGSRHVTDRRKN